MNLRKRFTYLKQRAFQQKLIGQADTHTHLCRCLSTLQMTAIGLGSTVGVGIYVLLGVAIKDYAGPGVLLSFLVAGLVMLTNGTIYAEFGSYIPHTGASYTYIYRVLGELAAFLAGWMGTLSVLSSAATGARAWSGFVDALFNNSIQAFIDQQVGQVDMGPPFARSLDFVACMFFLLVTVVVCFNVHCSSLITTVLAILTIAILVFVSVAGPVYGDIKRLANADHGGFLPYGLGGVITGASAAFFALSGFDSICISAEEAKDPVTSVPRAILIELVIVTVVYCSAAVGTVSLVPFTEIDLRAPIPSAFEYQGVQWAKLVVTIGPIFAITNLSILGLYTQSRISYRMAKDGLMLSKFAYISPKTKVPLLGVIVFGILTSIISLLLELKDLVRFSVMCMLFQYIVLAPALVALRAGDTDKGVVARKLSSTDDHELGCLEVAEPQEKGAESQNGALLYTSVSPDITLTSSPADSPSASSQLSNPRPLSYSYLSEGDLGTGSSAEGTASQQRSEFRLTNVSAGEGERSGLAPRTIPKAEHAPRASIPSSVAGGGKDLLVNVADSYLTSEEPEININCSRRPGPEIGPGLEAGSYDHNVPGPALTLSDSDCSDADDLQLIPANPRRPVKELVLKKDGDDSRSSGVVDGDGCVWNTLRVFYQQFLTTR